MWPSLVPGGYAFVVKYHHSSNILVLLVQVESLQTLDTTTKSDPV